MRASTCRLRCASSVSTGANATSRPLRSGVIFGLVAFVAMNYVVVPLSAAAVHAPRGAFLAGGLLAHMFLVGLPIAIASRRALGDVSKQGN